MDMELDAPRSWPDVELALADALDEVGFSDEVEDLIRSREVAGDSADYIQNQIEDLISDSLGRSCNTIAAWDEPAWVMLRGLLELGLDYSRIAERYMEKYEAMKHESWNIRPKARTSKSKASGNTGSKTKAPARKTTARKPAAKKATARRR